MANAINSKGVIAGSATLPDWNTRHAVIWKGGVLKDIPAVRAAGAALRTRDINDRGWIVGDTVPRPGRPSRGFVLIPG